MYVIRIVINGSMIMYFVGVNHSADKTDAETVKWAFVGNKIQSFVSEESAIRMLDDLQTRRMHHVRWDDSEEYLGGEDYKGQILRQSDLLVEILDLTDMVVCRHTRLKPIA